MEIDVSVDFENKIKRMFLILIKTGKWLITKLNYQDMNI